MGKKSDNLDYLNPYIDKIKEDGGSDEHIRIVLMELLVSTFEIASEHNGRAEDYIWGKEAKLRRQLEQLKNVNG